jgi:hypothetical protein
VTVEKDILIPCCIKIVSKLFISLSLSAFWDTNICMYSIFIQQLLVKMGTEIWSVMILQCILAIAEADWSNVSFQSQDSTTFNVYEISDGPVHARFLWARQQVLYSFTGKKFWKQGINKIISYEIYNYFYGAFCSWGCLLFPMYILPHVWHHRGIESHTGKTTILS